MMQNIDLGTVVNDGTGDPLRTGGQKINENFADLDTRVDAALAAGEEAGESAGTATETADNAATLAQEAKSLADNAQVRLTAGDNITIDNTDPLAPVISATGGGGGEGTVTSVAGIAPVAGNVPLGELSEALGVDDKLGKNETAVSANKLANPANINGTPFDGSQNITIVDDTKEPAIVAGQAGDYWNGSKGWSNFFSSVRSATLTGLVFTNAAAVVATDTLLSGIGKLQRQISDAVTAISNRAVKGNNGDITQLTGLTTPLSVAQGGTGSSSGVPDMVGASASTPGVKGLVPAPALGATRFLSSLGTWLTVNATAAWGGITGTLADQADLKTALDAKQNISSAPFTKFYESAQLTWTAGGLLTVPVGFDPKGTQIECIVTTAQGGSAVGDRFEPTPMLIGGAYVGAMVVSKSATNVGVRCATTMVRLLNAGSGDQITPANCRIILRAWA